MPEHESELHENRWIRIFIQALIVYSTITLFLETMPELAAYRSFFWISETVVVLIFTVEYFAGWFLAKDRRRYPFTFLAIVDLLAIAPYYLFAGIDLRAIRAVRLLRIVRVLKMARYSRALQTLGEAFRRCGPELIMAGFLALIVVIISAMALYYAENEAQPDIYTSMPAALWWAIVTLTTVGYGDVYPTTTFGRVVASFVMVMGIGFIAVPTSILSGTFAEIMRERREEEVGQNSENS